MNGLKPEETIELIDKKNRTNDKTKKKKYTCNGYVSLSKKYASSFAPFWNAAKKENRIAKISMPKKEGMLFRSV